ncbi:MAG: AAA family ATPase [Thermoanaerobaculia bacterium]|nr:AAA family ATPase [Thermoanaerobaculia bacterium]
MIAFKGGRVSAGNQRTGLGRNAGGLIAYLIRGERGPGQRRSCVRCVRGHQVPTHDPWVFLDFFETTASENPRCTRPVYHVGASAAPGESLSDDQWADVGADMLHCLGLEEHEALFVVHDGKDETEGEDSSDKPGQQHLHIVVNRVGPDGSVWSPSWDYPKLQTAMRRAEIRHSLRRVPSTSFERGQERGMPRLSDAAVCRSRAEGTLPLADRLRKIASEPLRDAESWTDLDQRLQPLGLAVRPARRGGGVLVVDAEGHEVSLSKVLRLSGPQLTRRFGIDLRTHRLQTPEPEFTVTEEQEESEAAPSRMRIVAEAVDTLREEYGVFRDRDIRRQVRWHANGAQLFEEITHHDELIRLGHRDGEGVWTTQTYRETERRLWASANRLHHGRVRGPDTQAVDDLLAADFSYFSSEQARAVRHATQGRRLTLLQGLAGTGKTSMAQAIARSYEAEGFRVVGAALSGRAADLLGEETGIESRTLASWDARWKIGRQALDERTVLLVDEASMVGARQMQQLLQRAEAQGASVILMGDPAQLRPIEPGDAFRGLLQLFPSKRLGEIRRQREEWQRTASQALAEGHADVAIHAYAARARVEESETREEALRAVVQAAGELPNDESRLVIAFRRRDVADLNERLRTQHFADEPRRTEIDIRGRRYAIGDRIQFCRNESRTVRTIRGVKDGPEPGVRNGALGTLTSLGGGEITVQLDSGRTVAFDPDEYTDLNYGYVGTLHAAQGATVDHSLVYADDCVDLQGIYVAGTRHRESLRLFYDRESFADLAAMVRSVSREAEPNLVLDHPEPSVSPDCDQVLAAMGSRRATWTRRRIESLCRAQGGDEELAAPDVLKHPEIIPLEPDLFTTRRQVLVEARLMEAAERLDRRESLEVLLDLDPEADPVNAWLERHASPDTTFEPVRDWLKIHGTERPTLLVSADPAGATDLEARYGYRGVTARSVVQSPGLLAEGCTVVVDRAELLGSETLADVLERVREAGGRAVVAGDPQGHPTKFGRGGDGFALLADCYAASEWQEHLDQKPQERMAQAIRGLNASERVSWSDEIVETAAQAYLDSGDARLLVASRLSTAQELNQAVQEIRTERGELGRRRYLHGGYFSRGDRVVLRMGSAKEDSFRDSGDEAAGAVEPDSRGVVEATAETASLVRLEDGRQIVVPKEYERLELAYAQTMQDMASRQLEGDVHAVLDDGFNLRATHALFHSAGSARLHLHSSTSAHPAGIHSILEQVTRDVPRDLAHDTVSAARRYRQLADAEVVPSKTARDQVDRLTSEDLSEESRADILKDLGAPAWSRLYRTLDQPTTESWADWQTRREVLADARRADVSIRALEDLHQHADRLIEPGARTWLEGATSRQIQRLAPGMLKTLLSLTRAATAIARDPSFVFRLVEPRALRWARTAFRIAGLLDTPKSQERSRERVQERGGMEWER